MKEFLAEQEGTQDDAVSRNPKKSAKVRYENVGKDEEAELFDELPNRTNLQLDQNNNRDTIQAFSRHNDI